MRYMFMDMNMAFSQDQESYGTADLFDRRSIAFRQSVSSAVPGNLGLKIREKVDFSLPRDSD
jgi:hypothetical protein